MSYRGNVIYLYDGSFEGLLSAVFDSYLFHEEPMSIERSQNGQLSLDCIYRAIETDAEKARRVSDKIIKCAGYVRRRHIYYAYLSEKPLSEINIAGYIRMCLKFGAAADSHLTVPCVDFVLDAARRTGHEAHKYTGFVRFSELEGGVYYGEIEPEHNVLPIIAPHFAKRYSNMPFLLHDTRRMLCIVYDCRGCVIRETNGIPKLSYSDDEMLCRRMWKKFYDTVEIKQRHNERCRMSLMPKRYWKHMTEFDEALENNPKEDSRKHKSHEGQGIRQISSRSGYQR